jgi:hypothetical protein
MKKTWKLWTGLGLATAASSTLAHATSSHDEMSLSVAGEQPAIIVVAGGEGGEGEGGGKKGDKAELDDAAYLTQLALMQGHLRVGAELYALGASDMAAQMKRPSDELYSGLRGAFKKRGIKGFKKELDALAKAIKGKAPAEEVAAAQAAVDAAIAKAMSAVKADGPTTLKVVIGLLRTGAEEFEAGVKGGKIIDVHEYQDAYGFTQVARKMVAEAMEKASAEQKPLFESALKEIDAVKPLWPDIKGEKPVTADAKAIAVAAAKIELLSYDLK